MTRSDFLAKQKDIKSKVYNSLKQYTYEFYKKELGGSQYITGEAEEKVIADIATYLVQLKGDFLVYDPLIQNIRTAHSKEVEFRNKAFKVFTTDSTNHSTPKHDSDSSNTADRSYTNSFKPTVRP